jgi:hypothetical protein
MANKLALTIIISIILTALIITILNVGASIILDRPNWEEFCEDVFDPRERVFINSGEEMNQEICEARTGNWIEYKETTKGEPSGRCDILEKPSTNVCQEEYNVAVKSNNQYRFYLFAGIGFILLILGLFISEDLIKFTGFASGLILIIEGTAINFQNKTIVFISLSIIFIIFGIFSWKLLKKTK